MSSKRICYFCGRAYTGKSVRCGTEWLPYGDGVAGVPLYGCADCAGKARRW